MVSASPVQLDGQCRLSRTARNAMPTGPGIITGQLQEVEVKEDNGRALRKDVGAVRYFSCSSSLPDLCAPCVVLIRSDRGLLDD